MLLDWPTVIFQIINFLILIGLLKRFLYGPITKAMDDRERQVMERLAEAAKTEKAAAKREADLRHEQEIFAGIKEKMVREARDEAEGWKNDAIVRMQSEIDQEREAWMSILATERETFLYTLQKSVTKNVFMIARKTLADLADETLEARIINTFVEKLNQKTDDLDLQFSSSMMQVSCITGFPLNESQKKQLAKALSATLGEGRELIFKVDAALGCGIRLVNDEQKVEWNVHRYMHELETEISTALNTLGRQDHGQ
jgi:F-type H+-transporting ATPase subunit b